VSPLESFLGSSDIAVLSPHSDDAALSLSGLLSLAADCGRRCTIITAFSRSRRTRTGGIEQDEVRVTAMRKREDEAFVSLLGSGACVLWCDLPDPSVRFPAARETWYVPRGALLAPMALGRNRDHLIVRDAALAFVRRSPRRLFLYEDLPYAARMSELELERDAEDLARAESLTLTSRRISYAALLLRKRQAVATYASQMNRDIVDRVLSYALRVGALVSPAERVWEVEFLSDGPAATSTAIEHPK